MATRAERQDARATAGPAGRLGGLVVRSALVARLRHALARHVARRRQAVRQARVREMAVVREGFTRAVEASVASSLRLQDDAAELLAAWSGGDGPPPADELARLRAALVDNARRREAARTRVKAVRAAYGHVARRRAAAVLRQVDDLGTHVEDVVATRLRSLRDPERRLLLRATGPAAWTISEVEPRQAAVEAALAAFRALTDERLRLAGATPPAVAGPPAG